MNLEEFRKALSSDATEENAQLKRQLSDFKTEYHEKLSKLENENDTLFYLCELAGFEIEGRIILVDKRNGRVWK